MSATDAAFAGSIPALYEQYLGSLLFQPYAEVMASRLNDLTQGRVLETAAGTGIVTRALAKALPREVEIVATDLNQAMLDLASGKLQAPNVRWQQADAQALPFDDASFDAVVCQFGVMFFPDKQAGYREALRVLKPGCRFLFNVWDSLDRNEVSRIVSEAAGKAFPNDPPRFVERVPFGYFDPDRIRRRGPAGGLRECGDRRRREGQPPLLRRGNRRWDSARAHRFAQRSRLAVRIASMRLRPKSRMLSQHASAPDRSRTE